MADPQSPPMAVALSPDPEARELAEIMVGPEAEEVHRNILAETLESAEGDGPILESGRTVCGDLSDVHESINRFQTAVDLPGCPVTDRIGIWHTHVTPDELRSPTHSLPDIANVALGLVDASVVVGAETSHVIVGAEDRAAMKAAFQDAVGVTVEQPADVVHAMERGDIENPQAAASAATSALGPLTDRPDTAYPALAQRIRSLEAPAIAASAPGGCAVHHHVQPDPPDAGDGHASTAAPRGCTCFRERAQVLARASEAAAPAGVDVGEIVVGQTVGLIVGRVVERAIFGG